MVSAKNILNPDLGPIGSLDSLVIKQIAQLSNPYSGVFSIPRPTVQLFFKTHLLKDFFDIRRSAKDNSCQFDRKTISIPETEIIIDTYC